jgi:hypothetical protein
LNANYLSMHRETAQRLWRVGSIEPAGGVEYQPV